MYKIDFNENNYINFPKTFVHQTIVRVCLDVYVGEIEWEGDNDKAVDKG